LRLLLVTSDWIKVKNPGAPAVRREAEEDWGEAAMKTTTGARWEVTVDGRPRTYDHKREELAIEAAEFLKLKNPPGEATVRDLEGDLQTTIISTQQPRVRLGLQATANQELQAPNVDFRPPQLKAIHTRSTQPRG
jgi:hypothetical protein